jgi:hypothetical protein
MPTICFERAVYETTRDDSPLHAKNMHFSSENRFQMRTGTDKVYALLANSIFHHILSRRVLVRRPNQKETRD